MEPIRLGHRPGVRLGHRPGEVARSGAPSFRQRPGRWRGVGAEIGTSDTVYPDSIWTLTIDARRKLTAKDVMEWAGA